MVSKSCLCFFPFQGYEPSDTECLPQHKEVSKRFWYQPAGPYLLRSDEIIPSKLGWVQFRTGEDSRRVRGLFQQISGFHRAGIAHRIHSLEETVNKASAEALRS